MLLQGLSVISPPELTKFLSILIVTSEGETATVFDSFDLSTSHSCLHFPIGRAAAALTLKGKAVDGGLGGMKDLTFLKKKEKKKRQTDKLNVQLIFHAANFQTRTSHNSLSGELFISKLS